MICISLVRNHVMEVFLRKRPKMMSLTKVVMSVKVVKLPCVVH